MEAQAESLMQQMSFFSVQTTGAAPARATKSSSARTSSYTSTPARPVAMSRQTMDGNRTAATWDDDQAHAA